MTETAVRSWAVRPASDRRGGSRPRLYCFPHAGGGASTFRSWREPLEGLAEVRTLAAPAPSERSADARTVQYLAALAADRVDPEPGNIFLGHSMGALVAFETVRELVRRGRSAPAALVVVAHAAPHLPRARSSLHALPSDRFWREVGELGGTPEEVLARPELREATEPRLRADFAAGETYRFTPGPPLTCDILSYVGNSDTQADVDSMRPWRMHTLGGFSLTERRGGHFFLHEDPRGVLTDVLLRLRTQQWEESRC